MFIQPYETRETPYAPLSSPANSTPMCSPNPMAFGDDAVSTGSPWSEAMLGDSQGILNDAPLGPQGMKGMLSSLTGMMQQLVQMMQSFLGGGTPGPSVR